MLDRRSDEGQTITMTELRRHFHKIMNRVAAGQEFIVTMRGNPTVRISPIGVKEVPSMNKENTERLYSDFDHLFRDRNKPEKESLMCWGFTCGDGWFPLVYAIARMITEYVKAHPEAECAAFQVKEKFGGLRFYIRGGDDTLHRMIWEEAQKSFAICETCSAPAIVRTSPTGAVRTLCDGCYPAWRTTWKPESARLI